jgi:RNA polymerase sigma factor (TIGR02999 family)
MAYRTDVMPGAFPDVLAASRHGNDGACAEAFAATYDELRRVARRELRRLRPGQTLTTTSLVHEAFVKLVRSPVDTADRTHFLALAARAMRQILVDYLRQRSAQKRGGDWRIATFDGESLPAEGLADELLAVDRALTELEEVDPRLARLVEWRFFGGMTEEEVATALDITSRTVRREWQKARAFLFRALKGADSA